jgi:hypothetical protein
MCSSVRLAGRNAHNRVEHRGSQKVYTDAQTFVFLDAVPAARGIVYSGDPIRARPCVFSFELQARIDLEYRLMVRGRPGVFGPR